MWLLNCSVLLLVGLVFVDSGVEYYCGIFYNCVMFVLFVMLMLLVIVSVYGYVDDMFVCYWLCDVVYVVVVVVGVVGFVFYLYNVMK